MNTHTETPASEIIAPERPPTNRRWLAPTIVTLLATILGGLLVSGILPRANRVNQLEQAAAAVTAKVTVAIAVPATALQAGVRRHGNEGGKSGKEDKRLAVHVERSLSGVTSL